MQFLTNHNIFDKTIEEKKTMTKKQRDNIEMKYNQKQKRRENLTRAT